MIMANSLTSICCGGNIGHSTIRKKEAYMGEFIGEAITLVNLPFTTLLGFVVIYWLLVIVGALDMNAFDFDLDVDAEGHGAGESQIGMAVAHFFHCDEGPFMAIVSLLTVFLWMGAMLLNHYFNSVHSWLMAGVLVVPNIVVSVALTKAIVFPVFSLLRRVQVTDEPSSVQMLGQVCRVVTLTADANAGQAEIERHGAPLRINVRVGEGEPSLSKGDSAVIFSENKENNTYLIKKLEDNNG